MKSSVQLAQKLKQTLSFELKQAIELLMLPSIELKLHIQSVLEKNPLLELDEEEAEESRIPHLPTADNSDYTSSHTPDFTLDLPDTRPYTVKAYLNWQLTLSHWTERDTLMGAHIIDSMNDEGYLQSDLNEIQTYIKPYTKSSISEILAIMVRIQEFDRTPPYEQYPNAHEIQIPDLMVWKQNGVYDVSLNMDFIPSVKIASQYTTGLKRVVSSRDKEFILRHLQEARWFVKALHIRNHNLLKAARCIVQHQEAFLTQGAKAMMPLHYNTIAKATELHESTISRLVCNKLILTPQGLLELKYFFGNGTQAIQAVIKQLFAEEHHLHPLSDEEMTQLLLTRGFKATRRTVAKYREAMAIPSSYHRRGA